MRELRGVGVNNYRPTIRACIAIARVLAHCGGHAHADDPSFSWICLDVLHLNTAKVTRGGESIMPEKVEEVMARVCGGGLANATGKPRKQKATD